MTFGFEAPEDVHGESNRITEPGTYHLVISNVREGEGPNGSPIDGFSFECDVVAGTGTDSEGKTHTESLFAPDLTKSEENQLMARRKLAAFFIATDLMAPDQLGKSVQIEVSEAIGRQILMKVEQRMKKNEQTGKYDVPTKYVQLSFADIYHVDDPEVKDIPKNGDAIGLIPNEQRHDASWFAFKEKKAGKTSQKQPAAAATSVAGGFDDLMD